MLFLGYIYLRLTCPCNLKLVVATFELPFARVALFVHQTKEHGYLYNNFFNKFGYNLGPKKCTNHIKINKIWWLMQWTENNVFIPFLLDVF